MDPAANQKDRIGVLEELLNERYSVRAFLPREVPRETIEHVLKTAQRTASWCNSQPWQDPDRERCGQGALSPGDLWHRGQFRRAGRRRLSVPARISRGLSRAPPRKRFSALQHARHRPRRHGGVCETSAGELQFLRRAACRHHPHRPRRSASTARSIAAPMSAISCWPRRRSGSAPSRRRRWRGSPA